MVHDPEMQQRHYNCMYIFTLPCEAGSCIHTRVVSEVSLPGLELRMTVPISPLMYGLDNIPKP